MEYSGAGGKLIHEKNQKQKILWHWERQEAQYDCYSPACWAMGTNETTSPADQSRENPFIWTLWVPISLSFQSAGATPL